MNENLLNRVLKDRKRRTRSLALILCLSMIVSLGTFAGFRKTAVAKVYTREVLDCPYTHEGAESVAHVHNDDCYDGETLVCTLPELEAHTHSDACYTERQVLTCTLEENPGHQHGDACYTEREELRCGLEENPGHQHGDACYTEREVLRCGLEENPGHQHGETCYDENGVLTCQIPEGEGAHTHTAECFETVQELTCQIPEGEGAHTHTAECFETVQELTCQIPEGEGAHAHTAECYETVRELTCQIPEGEGAHTHTAECYETVRELTCGKAELTPHVHGPECIRTEEITVDEPEVSTEPEATTEPEVTAQPEATTEPEATTAPEMPVSDPNADLESASDWERDFDGMELSGNWAEDLVLVAATQQGHGESQNNFEAVLNDAGDAWVRHGYTRYGAWSGAPYADEWSAMFVSFCLRYAGIPAENVPNNPTAALMAESFQKGELFAGPDYLPAVGDLIFFDTDDIDGIDHMGIVYHVDTEDGSINAVEGSRTDAVETFGYRMDDEEIAGYGILPQNPNFVSDVPENEAAGDGEDGEDDGFIVMNTDEEEEEEKKETEEVKPVEETKTAEEGTAPAAPMPAQSWERTAGGIKVTVDAPEGAFPENTKIAVTPVNGNSLKDTVSDAVSGEVLEVQAVDITFFDADGNEIEPALPIRVVMTPAETEHAEEKTNVVHIDLDQQTAEVIEQAAGTETDNSEVVFDAEAFTIYAIVYTYDVHFEYEVDGKTYTPASSMPGAKDLSLADVVRGLGIVEEQEIDPFVSKISTVASTDEAVVSAGQDGTIRVLKDGEAQIVITMQDGAQFNIDVMAEGETEVSDENNVAVVSTVNDLYLPSEAAVTAEVLDEAKSENAIAAVQTVAEPENSPASDAAYQVFEISLDGVEATDYEGFQVEVKLPEDVVGRDFRLYHIHNGETTEIELNTVSRPADDTGLEVVSGFTFETKDFSEFVLRYTVDFTYEGRTWSFPGEGSYRLADVLAVLGIEGSIDDAALTLIEGEDHAGALYLTQADGEYYINSDVAFFDTYELRVSVGEKVYLILVTDLQYTTNLSQVLTDLTISGAEWDPDTQSYTVKPGKTYTVNMTFEEGEGAGQYQFSNTDWMTLTLPDGVTFGAVGNTFDIYVNEAGDNFTIQGNTVVVEGNTIKVKLNDSDPNYQKLRDLTTAKFSISVTGVFNEEWHQHEIDGQTHVTIKVDDTPDVDVRKSGSITDWNSDPEKATVTYQLEVRSNGNTSGVVITDTIQGTGLQFNHDSIRITQNGQPVTGWETTVQSTTGFTLKTGELHDGQIYIVTYTATLDKNELDLNGDGTYSIDANNKVEWTGDKTTTHDLGHVVTKPEIHKAGTTISQNGSETITKWTIEADSDYGDNNRLKNITDKIATDGIEYSGDGIHVVVKDRDNYSVKLEKDIPWDEILNSDRKSWTYDVTQLLNNEGKKYHYTITYNTTYNIGDATQGQFIKNDWEDDNGNEGHGQSWVNPNPQNKYDLKKEFTKKEISGEDTIVTWTIRVTVPASGVPADKAVLTETLPFTGGYQDTYVENEGVQKDGLYSGEDITVDGSKPGKVLITFTNDGNPGLKKSEDEKARTITLILKTKCDPRWLEDNKAELSHKNKVEFAGHQADAIFTPEKPSIRKEGRRDGDADGLPKFTYNIIAGVFSEDLFQTPCPYPYTETGNDDKGPYVIIGDTFDERLAYVEGSAEVYGGDQYWQGSGNADVHEGVVATVEGNNITFKLYKNSLPKNAGNLYQYYRVGYSLKIKDQETLERLRNQAIADGKAVELGNTVTGFGGHTTTVKYEPKILDKTHAVQDDKLIFTVTVNQEGLTLSDNGVLVLTDDMENLSVRYQDITIAVEGNKTVETTDSDGNPVTAPYFNMKGNRITFYLPDGAPITITYRATPRGEVGADGNIQYSNTVRLNGFEKTDSGVKTFNPEGAGYGTNYGVYIYKADGLVNSNALAGAVFKLYEADEVDANGNIVSGTPVRGSDGIDYTVTTSDGKDGSQKGLVRVMGTEDLGWNLKPEKRYYLLEVQAPEGYALDNTKYSFVISKDGYVNYSSNPVVAPDGSGKIVQAWTYHNGDVLTVKDWRKDGVLTLEKSFVDIKPSEMDDDQKAALKFKIYTVKDDGTETLWRTITYDQFTVTEVATDEGITEKKYTYTIGDLPEGKYKVVEQVDDRTCKETTYAVMDNDEGAGSDTGNKFATIVISAEDVANNTENKVKITNRYEVPSQFKIYKHAVGETSYKISGAEFGVFTTDSSNNYAPTDEKVASYTTNSRGRFTITQTALDGQSELTVNTIYALKETKAPDGFLINEDVTYFFFQGTDASQKLPENAPKGTIVIEWEKSEDYSIEDTPKTTYLQATKKYLNDMLDEDTDNPSTSVDVIIRQIASYDKEGKVIEPALSGYYLYNQEGPVKPVSADKATVYQIVKDGDPAAWHLSGSGVNEGKLQNLPTMTFDNHIPIYYHYEVEEINPGEYVPIYEYTKNTDGSITATVTNKPNTDYPTTKVKAQKKWVDIEGNDVTGKMGLDDGVSLQIYRTQGVINKGKIITESGATYDASKLYPIICKFGDGVGAINGTIINPYIAVLPGDTIQIRITKHDSSAWNHDVTGFQTETWGTSEIGLTLTDETENVQVGNLVVPNTQPIEYIRVRDYGTYPFEVELVNLTAENEGRTQLLTHEESNTVGGVPVQNAVLELNKLNGWKDVSQDLITGDGKGTVYSYYLLEDDGDLYSAQYSISGDAVIITNVETKIELKKIWHGANGTDDITKDKEDGEVKFTLKRYTYPIAYGNYTGTGNINVLFENNTSSSTDNVDEKPGFWYGRPNWVYNRITEENLTGNSQITNIKAGSTVRIVVSTSGKDNTDPDNDVIRVNGVPVNSNWVMNPSGSRMRYSRTITLENVQSDIILSGILDAEPSGLAEVMVTVLKEPVDQDLLGTETIGEITLSADSSSFTPTGGYESIGITTEHGLNAWSAILNNLPNSEYSETHHQTVVYKYEAIEQVSESDSYIAQENSGITSAGGVITQTNKLKSGSLKVKKVVEGAAPDGKTYEIAVTDAEGNYYGTDGTNYGQTPHYEVFSANAENSWKIWTHLTPGMYTVSEKNASVEGYTWTASGTGAVKVQQDKTTEATVTNSYFKNAEYTPKVTKYLKTGDAEVSPWPSEISFEFYLSFESGSNGGVPLSSTDVVMTNRNAMATETDKTAKFGKIEFKKPGVYTFKIEEVEPAGAQNHKKDGIVYSTVPVTLAVEVGPKDGEPGVLEVKSKTYSPANGKSEGGLITNTMDYPSYAPSVTKVLKNGETDVTGTNWGDRSFTFTLANTTTGDLSDHVIMPSSPTRTVTKNSTNHKETFDAITFKAAGAYTFTVTETVPDDATNATGKKYSEATDAEKTAGGFSLNGVTYDGAPKSFTVTVAPDAYGNLAVTKVTVAGKEITGEAIIGSGVTVENTLVEKTDFEFSKVWLAMTAGAYEVSSDDLQTWPTGKSITVKIFRKNGDSSTATVDQNFELIYTINGSETQISPTGGKVNGQSLNDTDKAAYQLTMTKTEDGKIITFKTDKVLDLKNADTNWVYYVEETAVSEGYGKDGYGKKTATGTGGTTITKAQGAKAAANGEVIMNRESSGYELPETGGIGTALFTALGGLMTATAGVILTLRRTASRRRGEKKAS